MVAKKLPIRSKPVPRKPSVLPTAKMQAFARALYGGLSKKDAAMRAGVSEVSASEMAKRWGKDPRVIEYQRELATQGQLNAEVLNSQIVDAQNFNLMNFFEPESRAYQMLERSGQAHLVRKIKITEDVTGYDDAGQPLSHLVIELEGPDKLGYHRLASSHLGMAQRPKMNSEDQKHYDKMLAEAMAAADASGEFKSAEHRDQYRQGLIKHMIASNATAEPYLSGYLELGKIG